MRMPHVNLSPDSLTKNFGFYLLVRLQAVPEVAPVLEYFQGVRAALLEAMAAHEAAVDGRRAAMARRDFQSDQMEQEIRVLAFTILGLVSNNRSAPSFRHYFPTGYGDVLDIPILEQRRRSVVLLEKLGAERDPIIRSRMEPFQAQLQELENALAELEAARDLEARMRSNRETAKVAWMDGYRRTHGMLQDHYAGDPRRAESFFREVRAQARNQVEDDFELEEDLVEAAVVEAEADEDDDPDSETIDDDNLAEGVGVSDI